MIGVNHEVNNSVGNVYIVALELLFLCQASSSVHFCYSNSVCSTCKYCLPSPGRV